MHILVVHRAWVEWIINDLFSDSGAPRMRGLFFIGVFVYLDVETKNNNRLLLRSRKSSWPIRCGNEIVQRPTTNTSGDDSIYPPMI